MSEPFIAEIRIFAGNFAPRGWAFCNGQLLPVAQNSTLFSIIGTTYGGDGRTTTALPNLQGRVPMHAGHGAGLSPRQLGQQLGEETVSLNETQIPQHQHSLQTAGEPEIEVPADTTVLAAEGAEHFHDATSLVKLHASSVTSTGGGQAHNNMQPYLSLNYIIALTGLYPSRS
ncbi:MAG: phage tail protein [Methyloprofundus sp.]|nr:phage tail protein [Methyloprofundus sp.]